jgi:phosphatidylserine decarboxylase
MTAPFRKEGAPFLLSAAGLFLASLLGAWLMSARWGWLLQSAAVFGLLLLFLLYFFRDPERSPEGPIGARDLLSPADGVVMEVKEVQDPLYMKGRALQVNIFLSVFNVHVQRAPFAGKVEYLKYSPGKFLAAFHKDAETQNEQNCIGLKCGRHRILVKQITGAIARRILCFKGKGEKVARGERLGMILMGSQVDILLPGSAKVTARKGDKVRAGRTVIGRL